MPPSPRANGPPQERNLSPGAHAAVKDNDATTPAVQAAARTTKGPPSSMRGAMIKPTTPLCPEVTKPKFLEKLSTC